MKKLLAVVAIALSVTGCATHKNWEANGGSKSDGVITISYLYGEYESPESSAVQGDKVAIHRCKLWGFDSAESFSMGSERCNSRWGSQGACKEYLVSKTYQCTSN
jgi:hypothetical protein